MKRWILFLIMIAILMCYTGCRRSSEIKLIRDELGYNLSDYLDQPQENLIVRLKETGVNLQEEEKAEDDRIPWRSYSYSDVISNIDFKVTLSFGVYGDSDEYRLMSYVIHAEMEQWPTGDIAENLQVIADQMVKKYGEPSELENIDDVKDIFNGYETGKLMVWDKEGDYAGRSFSVERDSLKQDTILIKINEQSEEGTKAFMGQ